MMLPMFLLVVSFVIGAESSDSHCLGSDVLCTTTDYQLRRYKDSVWVGTHVDASINPRVDDFMQLLISYTRGENSAGLWMKSNGQFIISFTGDGKITMYLLVPEELWENPPKPTSPQTFITRLPTMDVISRTIRLNVMTQANDFNRTLTEQNAKFNNSFFFVSFCKGPGESAVFVRPIRRNRFRRCTMSSSERPSCCCCDCARGERNRGSRDPLRPLDGRSWRRTFKRLLYSGLRKLKRYRKRGKRSPEGAFTSGGSFSGKAEVPVGGVSYDFTSMPAGDEVWFVATGEMDCPRM